MSGVLPLPVAASTFTPPSSSATSTSRCPSFAHILAKLKFKNHLECSRNLLNGSVQGGEAGVIVNAVVAHAGALAKGAAVGGSAADVLHAAAAVG